MRPRRRPLDREFRAPVTKLIRKNERALLSGSTSIRDGGLFNGSAGISARVGIVLGTAAFVFFILTAVGFWLVPALTNGARDDVPSVKTAQRPPTLSSAAMIPSPQRHDSGRDATAVSAETSPPEQTRSVAVVIPPRTPSLERLPDSQPDQLPNSSPPTETSPPWVASPESATTTQQLDLNQTEDAKRVQQRLIERGFLFGAADGVWGSRSRKALQDFRIANGMGDGDAWDEATQERLLTASDANAANISDINFIGGWGTDAAQCRRHLSRSPRAGPRLPEQHVIFVQLNGRDCMYGDCEPSAQAAGSAGPRTFDLRFRAASWSGRANGEPPAICDARVDRSNRLSTGPCVPRRDWHRWRPPQPFSRRISGPALAAPQGLTLGSPAGSTDVG